MVPLDHLMKGSEVIRGIARDEDNRRTMFVYRCVVVVMRVAALSAATRVPCSC